MSKSEVKDQFYVGLDIGTTKICAMVGTFNPNGKLVIMGSGIAESKGVNRGVVANIDVTSAAIAKAITMAADKAGVNIDEVNVGIAGQHIQSMHQSFKLLRNNKFDVITEAEIHAMREKMMFVNVQPGHEIIDVIPQDYTIDDESGIQNPIGHSGTEIKGNYHIITGQFSAIENIAQCVKKADIKDEREQPLKLKINYLTLEPLASAEAVLSPEEKEAGVVLVDIGGGTTDIAIFHEHIIRHSAVIPFGGNSITNDITYGCNVLKLQAEALKRQFGNAWPEDTSEKDIITIPGIKGRDPKEISMRNLSLIIHARMAEIMELVKIQIELSGLRDKLSAGIVLTGGGALLKNIRTLVEEVTGLSAKIGYPNEHLAPGTYEVKSPVFSTCVGLMITEKIYRDLKYTSAMEIREDVKRRPGTTFQDEPPSQQKPVINKETNEHRSNTIKKFLDKIRRIIENDEEDNLN